MEIVETQIYRGANYWAPLPAIRFLLDIASPTVGQQKRQALLAVQSSEI